MKILSGVIIELLLPHTRPHSVFEKNVWMISFTPSKEGEHLALAIPRVVALTLHVLMLIIKRLLELNSDDIRFVLYHLLKYICRDLLALVHVEIQT